jgi:hypothetical protein
MSLGATMSARRRSVVFVGAAKTCAHYDRLDLALGWWWASKVWVPR